MGEIIRMTETQAARVKRLVRKQCANYDNGNCLLLDDGDFIPCPQLITRSLLCRYFRYAVLPGDHSLSLEIYGDRANHICVRCGQPFYSRGNRARYCPRCRRIRELELNCERVRRHRGSM